VVSDFSLEGHHVVVTGGTGGLGGPIASACARAHAAVTLVARRPDLLEGTVRKLCAEGHTIRAVSHDLADLDGVASLVDRLEEIAPIDGIVHAAGVQIRRAAVDFTVDEWHAIQRVNFDAPYFLSCEIARRQLSRAQPGSHVVLASLASIIGLAGAAAYTASKSGIMGVVHTLAIEWAQSGIRVNAVAPGYFYTDLTAALLDQPAQRERILGRIPMRRLGEPDDLGGPVVFLLSSASRYVTGHLLNVDGGWLAS
jgi:2-deoxy-D-gluconate 3-dehydrogenase